jgi:hypothetical protein
MALHCMGWMYPVLPPLVLFVALSRNDVLCLVPSCLVDFGDLKPKIKLYAMHWVTEYCHFSVKCMWSITSCIQIKGAFR